MLHKHLFAKKGVWFFAERMQINFWLSPVFREASQYLHMYGVRFDNFFS